MIRNPFYYGGTIQEPSMFIGRKREIKQVYECVVSGADCVIVGERRIGKTSLLRYIADPTVEARNGLDAKNYIFAYLDCQGRPNITFTDLWKRLLFEVAGQVKSVALFEKVKGVMEKDEITLFDLEVLFAQCNETDLNIILLFDEFGAMTANPNLDQTFYGGLRNLSNNLRVHYIVTTQRPLLELQYAYLETMTSPFFNTFRRITLGLFAPEEVEELLTTALRGTGVTFSEPDRQFLDEMADHHPYFLQMAAHHLFEAYIEGYLVEGPPPAPDYIWLTEWLQDDTAEHFRYYWDHSHNGEKLILATLSLLERGDIAKYKLGHTFHHDMLKRLRHRALVTQRDSELSIFSALFAGWVVDELSSITTDKVEDFQQLIAEARVKGFKERWLDTTERVKKGFARIDVKAIAKWLLVDKGAEYLSELLVKLFQLRSP
jgi:hypothetical protein